ncbi:GT2 family glycosyltransferase [Sediminihabitans luteus]|uniref:GT2 family glycosyltransferase n=1 Tax=Sediminihabitans luteus TaxID=1138585 RepID=A0A2M9CD65_9CELL|nr:glycosyltransferase family 2 protein [Sediminihabitans luteus]PJJ69874.1 GT2 family glycosyltransferase [Sediminihabitans luteus]GII99193.1 hypothetical protein Slu03_15710 [Sediminihabitans luteus]
MVGSLAVVVVNFGSTHLLTTNLVRVVQEARPTHVVVVDNFSDDAERHDVRAVAEDEGWTLVAPDENLGFGGGVNRGAAVALAAGATDLLVVNPDAWIDGRSVERLAAQAADDRLVMLSPVVKTSDGRVWFSGLDVYLDDGSIHGPRRRDELAPRPYEPWLSGACLWITAEAWQLVGGFDDAYFLYWEDVDLSVRARRLGIRVAVVDDAVAVHDEGGTHRDGQARAEAKSGTYYYFNIRNRMVFAARHLDAAGVRAWRRTSLAQARAILLRGGRRQFLRPLGPLRAAARGLRDGRRAARTLAPLPTRVTTPSDEEKTHG